MKKNLLALILFLAMAFSVFLYYKEGTLPVNDKDKTTKIFVIQRGETVTQIAKNLEKEELIRNRIIFYLVVKQLGIENKIQAGDFRLSPSINIYEIARTLTKGTLDLWITIIEGLRKEEIAQIFSRELSVPESEFLKYAQEGYLFPDTYLIPKDATTEAIVKILEKNFYHRFDERLRQKIADKGLDVNKAVIIASLVEREAKFDNDRALVASVIFNRLKIGMKLDIDATVQYALSYQPNEKMWWKKNLTKEDLEIDSPYNTYKNPGLPPTPISNPGLSAIKAVINVPETNYLYYISDKKGKMHFARTLEEHNENIRKYLR